MAFEGATTLAPQHHFGNLAGVVTSRDGSVYVLDELNTEIVKIGPGGNVVWRRGRKGTGPGEYRVPYRIAARPEGGVAVLDWGTGRITLLSTAGAIEGSRMIPFPFSQFDGFEVLPDGRFLIAGMTNWGGEAARHSVHVFTDSMKYQHSFGPHAVAEDTASVRYTGSGGVSITGDRVYFTRKRPYDIHAYDLSGKSLSRTVVKVEFELGLEDMIEVTRFNNRTFRNITPRSQDVQIPFPARPLANGEYLAGRVTWNSSTVDLISRDGTLLASAESPAGCRTLLAVDVSQNTVYCDVRRDEVPTLVRVKYSITPTRR